MGPRTRAAAEHQGAGVVLRQNLPNRFEEAYGDASNLRGRYPLAATGFLFVQRSTLLREEPDAFERTVDMIRKLRDNGGHGGYTATGLALVGWDEAAEGRPIVTVQLVRVPDDISPSQFIAALIEQIVTVTPVSHHVPVREKREHREIPLPEPNGITDDTTEDPNSLLQRRALVPTGSASGIPSVNVSRAARRVASRVLVEATHPCDDSPSSTRSSHTSCTMSVRLAD